MSILDTIEDDPSPLSVVIDFSEYALGAKLSTKAREYFEINKSKFGITGSTQEDYVLYFAHVLFDRMKDEMKVEAEEAAKNIITQTVLSVGASSKLGIAEIEVLELVKL